MMTITQKIYQEVNSLSQEEQEKVFQFIRVLKLKTPTPAMPSESPQTAWNELDQIGQSLSKKWNPNISATQIISELRR